MERVGLCGNSRSTIDRGTQAGSGMTTARRLRTLILVALLSLLILGVLAEVVSAIEVPLPTKEQMVYGDFPVVGRRVAVWVIAQLHLMFGAFVVGVPLFILIIEIMGAATKSQRYDDLAHEFTRLLSVAFSTTATFGGILVFFLIGLYPTFTNFLARIFFPSMVVYVFLFFGESFSMYLYYYGWEALKGTSRRFGTVLGTAILTLLVLYPAVLLLSSVLFSAEWFAGVVWASGGPVHCPPGIRRAFEDHDLPAQSEMDAHLLWYLAELLWSHLDDDFELLGHVHDLACRYRCQCRGIPGYHLGGHE